MMDNHSISDISSIILHHHQTSLKGRSFGKENVVPFHNQRAVKTPTIDSILSIPRTRPHIKKRDDDVRKEEGNGAKKGNVHHTKSIRKRVMSKVKEGVLSRNKSVSKHELIARDDVSLSILDQSSLVNVDVSNLDEKKISIPHININTHSTILSTTKEDYLKVKVKVVIFVHPQDNNSMMRHVYITPRAMPPFEIIDIEGGLYYDTLKATKSINIILQKRNMPLSDDNNFDELCSEIEDMLGTSIVDMLSIKVEYYHSCFPENTIIVTRHSCNEPNYEEDKKDDARKVWHHIRKDSRTINIPSSSQPNEDIILMALKNKRSVDVDTLQDWGGNNSNNHYYDNISIPWL